MSPFADKINGASDLFDGRLGVNARRMLQVLLCLIDHTRNRFQPLTQIGNSFLRRVEIARHEQIKAVGETLIVNERVPIGLLQLFDLEDAIVDVLFENAKIDIVRPA